MAIWGKYSDYYNAKTFTELTGLSCLNTDSEMQRIFKERRRKVYLEILKARKAKEIVTAAERDKALVLEKVSFENKVKQLASKIRGIRFHGADFFSAVATLTKRYFPGQAYISVYANLLGRNDLEPEILYTGFERIKLNWKMFITINNANSIYGRSTFIWQNNSLIPIDEARFQEYLEPNYLPISFEFTHPSDDLICGDSDFFEPFLDITGNPNIPFGELPDKYEWTLH